MTTDNDALKQVTADDIGGFVNTILSLLNDDRLKSEAKSNLKLALDMIQVDLNWADSTQPEMLKIWFPLAFGVNPQPEVNAPEPRSVAQASQSDEAEPYLEAIPVDPVTLGSYFPDDDAESIVSLIVDTTEEHAVETLTEFALHFYNMLGSEESEHIKIARRDMGLLLEAAFNRTKTHASAFRLYRMQSHIQYAATPSSLIEKAIAENISKEWGGEA